MTRDAHGRSDERGPRRQTWQIVGLLSAAAALTTVVLVAPWSSDDRGAEQSAAVIAAIEAPPASLTGDPTPGAISAEEPVLDAADLRLLLEHLLGEHAIVVSGASAAVADGGAVVDALAAVRPNTDRLAGAIGLVYGDVGAQAFVSLWSQHVAFFADRGAASRSGDQAGISEADRHLQHYERDFGSFASTATAGGLPAEIVTLLLEGHVGDVNGFVDAHLAGDGEAAAAAIATGYQRVADIGAGLATAISAQGPRAFPGDTSGPGVERASQLGRAMAVHLAVSSLALDAPEARRTLREDLIDALASVAHDPARARSATVAWLDADPATVDGAARALAEAMDPQRSQRVGDLLIVHRAGLDAGLLADATRVAHDAAHELAGILRPR